MRLKTKYFLFILICITANNFFGQKIVFTKGVFHTVRKKQINYIEYSVNGKTYQVFRINGYRIGIFNSTDIISYNIYVGYDSLAPGKVSTYYSRPYFDTIKTHPNIVNTTGKIIYVYKNYCEYHYITNNNKKIVAARQTLSIEEIKRYNISPGASFKVQYLKEMPAASIIYYEELEKDTLINWEKPALAKPNGLALEFETSAIFLNANSLNQYLSKYSQHQIKNTIPTFMFNISYYYKSGFWWGFGLGGAHKLFIGKLGVGYLQKISRRFYVNISSYFSNTDYSRSPFENEQFKKLADSCEFSYSKWYFNPKIDFLWRISKTDVKGCHFLKIGVGVFCDLNPNKKWDYEIGHEAIGNRGVKYTSYSFSSHINSMPTFPRYIFYLSVSYALHNIRKP